MLRKKRDEQLPIVTRYISIREAAIMLSLDPSTVYRMVESGELPAYRITTRRIVLNLQELEEYVRVRRTVPESHPLLRDRI